MVKHKATRGRNVGVKNVLCTASYNNTFFIFMVNVERERLELTRKSKRLVVPFLIRTFLLLDTNPSCFSSVL